MNGITWLTLACCLRWRYTRSKIATRRKAPLVTAPKTITFSLLGCEANEETDGAGGVIEECERDVVDVGKGVAVAGSVVIEIAVDCDVAAEEDVAREVEFFCICELVCAVLGTEAHNGGVTLDSGGDTLVPSTVVGGSSFSKLPLWLM